jgi:hypothetical protein
MRGSSIYFRRRPPDLQFTISALKRASIHVRGARQLSWPMGGCFPLGRRALTAAQLSERGHVSPHACTSRPPEALSICCVRRWLAYVCDRSPHNENPAFRRGFRRLCHRKIGGRIDADVSTLYRSGTTIPCLTNESYVSFCFEIIFCSASDRRVSCDPIAPSSLSTMLTDYSPQYMR